MGSDASEREQQVGSSEASKIYQEMEHRKQRKVLENPRAI